MAPRRPSPDAAGAARKPAPPACPSASRPGAGVLSIEVRAPRRVHFRAARDAARPRRSGARGPAPPAPLRRPVRFACSSHRWLAPERGARFWRALRPSDSCVRVRAAHGPGNGAPQPAVRCALPPWESGRPVYFSPRKAEPGVRVWRVPGPGRSRPSDLWHWRSQAWRAPAQVGPAPRSRRGVRRPVSSARVARARAVRVCLPQVRGRELANV
ncbi:hypothetical protein ACSSS7_007287 [Eimeria intestinalis]